MKQNSQSKSEQDIICQYDIRGIVDQSLTPKLSFAIGCSFYLRILSMEIKFYNSPTPPTTPHRNSSVPREFYIPSIVVGKDTRQSGLRIEECFIKGAIHATSKLASIKKTLLELQEKHKDTFSQVKAIQHLKKNSQDFVQQELLSIITNLNTSKESKKDIADASEIFSPIGKTEIIRLGECSTPMVHFASKLLAKEITISSNDISKESAESPELTTSTSDREEEAVGAIYGVMITASHNPSQYNGFKFIEDSLHSNADQESQHKDNTFSVSVVQKILSNARIIQDTLKKDEETLDLFKPSQEQHIPKRIDTTQKNLQSYNTEYKTNPTTEDIDSPQPHPLISQPSIPHTQGQVADIESTQKPTQEIEGEFNSKFSSLLSVEIGVIERDINQQYTEHLLSGIDTNRVKSYLKNTKIAIQDCDGGSRKIVARIADILNISHINSFQQESQDIDKYNPLSKNRIAESGRFAKENSCNFILSLDGDGDRLVIIDKEGQAISGDTLAIIFLDSIKTNLQQGCGQSDISEQPQTEDRAGNPKEGGSSRIEALGNVIIEMQSSITLQNAIQNRGMNSQFCKTGHSFFKHAMKESNAIFGAEISGHFYFRDTHAGYDDGLYAALRFVNHLAVNSSALEVELEKTPKTFISPTVRVSLKQKNSLSIIPPPPTPYSGSKGAVGGVIPSTSADLDSTTKETIFSNQKAPKELDPKESHKIPNILQEIENYCIEHNLKYSNLDGIKVFHNDFWITMRESRTESVLVARYESESQEGFQSAKLLYKHFLTLVL